MKVVIIAPEPGAWLPLVLAGCPKGAQIEIFAPWATRWSWLGRLPGRIGRYCARRRLTEGAVKRPFGWTIKDGLRKLHAGSDVDRLMTYRFTVRAELDRYVAPKLDEKTQFLIGTSLGCHDSFERASQWATQMILVEDLPNIETLHADLDQAVSCHPKRAFLRRFRASPAQIRVQKAEQSFAHAVAIRGWFAAHQRSELTGAGPIQFAWNLPQKTGSTSAPRAEGPFHVVLAGGASARNGVMEALAILEARKDLILWVRPTDGLMPSSLIQHPRVRHFRNQTELPKDIDCLLAPAWVESYPPELHMAIQRGIPVVGSLRAVGFLSDSPAAHIVPPGEIEKIGAALKRALKSQPDTKAKLPSFGCLPPDLREWSASLNLG